MIVGAGETGELTAKALVEAGVSSVFVANRHYDRAIGLAQLLFSLICRRRQSSIPFTSGAGPSYRVARVAARRF